MTRVTEQAHQLIGSSVKPGNLVVDATVGNGNDTVFLAELVGPDGRVLGFDIQDPALAETSKRTAHLPQVTLIHGGHETLSGHVPTGKQLDAVMFNLGYLPGGDKSVVTRAATTRAALEQALAHLKIHGLVTLILYPGHSGGAQEAEAVRAFAHDLDDGFAVSHHGQPGTRRPAPEIVVIERLC